MKIELQKTDDGELKGYDLVPETEEDHDNLGQVRNMIFFGIRDNTIKYAGREMSKENSYDPKDLERLKFRKEKFMKRSFH